VVDGGLSSSSDEAMDKALAVKFLPAVTAASLTISGEDDASLESAPGCFNFSYGAPDRMEFYSPSYPNNYPNHTDCIKVLKGE